MSSGTWDLILLAVASLGVLAFARYYVLAVLDEDKPLARAAAVAFVVSGITAAVLLVRVLT